MSASSAGSGSGRITDLLDRAEQHWAVDSSTDDARAYALSARVLYVARLIEQGFVAKCRSFGLATGELLVLEALHRLGAPYEATPAQLRKYFFVSFAGIGKRVNKLEALGYIERGVVEADKRSQTIRLTQTGLTVLSNSSRSGHEQLHRAALSSMCLEDQKTLAALLRQLQQNMEKIGADHA
ncbi:MarR family winged helix-turn-helix transcriptional regulator [Novosphingobium taihuense]|uniref:DNA-binding MarR family transcriptional regulator n=1 Tax=Novosphingobium taihuense TaxID=260085 RepID=A0A7W7ABZ7_9SPHN|nr:MarR family transcriptional regulator [Novosphingobium taihuense]MBB4614228.1 DNA-binding MarR family transcriptional regulator [Novosphingobium taihuense]TWH87075.1 DNA-binding MarR family transcriptional regulator [Novosphingobium taihuense]